MRRKKRGCGLPLAVAAMCGISSWAHAGPWIPPPGETLLVETVHMGRSSSADGLQTRLIYDHYAQQGWSSRSALINTARAEATWAGVSELDTSFGVLYGLITDPAQPVALGLEGLFHQRSDKNRGGVRLRLATARNFSAWDIPGYWTVETDVQRMFSPADDQLHLDLAMGLRLRRTVLVLVQSFTTMDPHRDAPTAMWQEARVSAVWSTFESISFQLGVTGARSLDHGAGSEQFIFTGLWVRL